MGDSCKATSPQISASIIEKVPWELETENLF